MKKGFTLGLPCMYERELIFFIGFSEEKLGKPTEIKKTCLGRKVLAGGRTFRFVINNK